MEPNSLCSLGDHRVEHSQEEVTVFHYWKRTEELKAPRRVRSPTAGLKMPTWTRGLVLAGIHCFELAIFPWLFCATQGIAVLIQTSIWRFLVVETLLGYLGRLSCPKEFSQTNWKTCDYQFCLNCVTPKVPPNQHWHRGFTAGTLHSPVDNAEAQANNFHRTLPYALWELWSLGHNLPNTPAL